ncbi:MAG TPA: LacI family DNA-binding transcriptional regulator [Microbacterium sp.]|nr:LacI family DNA-binding transcriptional regulator [Microbacterium sp.]
MPASSRDRPTIRDVAAHAGVSKSLVSLLFSGGSVSAERRERILASARELGYRPNLTARTLSASDGGFTGILVADLHNTVFAEVVDAARAELSHEGRAALLTSALLRDPDGEPRLDERALEIFRDLRPRSVLVVGSIPDLPALVDLIEGTPLVVASAVAEGLAPAATVHSDEQAGMALAVSHLVERGHSRIAHVGGRGGEVAVRRERAYARAMADSGLGDAARVAPSDYTERGGYRAAAALLDQADPPTGVVAVNDMAAIGVLAAAAERGVRLAVTGYDNTALSALRQIDLTSVDPRNAEIGAQAARRIIQAEDGGDDAGEILVAPRLVARASTS